MPLGAVAPVTLPLRDLNGSAQQTKHFFNTIYNHEGPIIFDVLAPVIREKAWTELPPPFGLKKDLSVELPLQLFVLPQANGKNCIVKHIYITKVKVKASLISEAAYGSPQEVIWGQNAKNTNKALQFMLEQMGGTQFRLCSLSPDLKKTSKAATVEKSQEDLDKGFEFTWQHGERDKRNLKLLWISKKHCW